MSNTETKTETKKTEKAAPAGAAQAPVNPFAAFALSGPLDPMAYWNASQQMFRDAITQAHSHASTMADGCGELASRLNLAALDPMDYWSSFREAMGSAQVRSTEITGKLDAQYTQLEQQLVERAHLAVATWAQLANDAISYSARLSVEARKLGAETAKKMGATA
jgi:hypothetical protein